MKYLMIGASAVALMALPAIAQTAAPPSPDRAARWNAPQTRADLEKKIAERFAAADANKDGAVTEAELKARAEARRAEIDKTVAEARTRVFESMDADKNGQVSRQEWDSHHAGMKAKWKERRETASADGKDRGAWMKGGRDGRKGHRMMHRGGHDGFGGFGGGFGAKWIESADANKDGRVTLAEAKAKPLARFDAADTNKDGTLSPEERKAAREAMRAERRAERGDS
ncbi:EF-hand domain-containing protein [Sphingosinicella microcystinivorans]|uniref:EF-hand domain-containing protein n=1 Tax=Sphingosinicella microcystinivorans TaxID=335406 RepID=UPI0022F406BC|nr:EF-hand domain-containing protein [Sphingosinicella microcystinivorans]WBX84851.1 EF-hand domain-containing protein [Sphingosinicella microcystinivorans]